MSNPKSNGEQSGPQSDVPPQENNKSLEFSNTCVFDIKDLMGTIKEAQGKKDSDDSDSPSSGNLLDLFGEETKALRASDAKPQVITPILMEKLGFGADTPLGKAATTTSQLAGKNIEHPSYHNPQHITEVIIAAYWLGLREHLPNDRVAEIVVAAAAHDLGHTGKTNTFPYELESRSYEIAYVPLVEAGLDEMQVERIGRMIMSTDFMNGVPLVREAYKETRVLPRDNEDAMLCAQCMILSEADILFSCFDEYYNDMLSKLLSVEWGKSNNLTHKERIGFLSSVKFVSDASAQLGLDDRRQKIVNSLNRQTAQL